MKFHALFGLWGVGILVCHLMAAYHQVEQPEPLRCSLNAQPWFATQYTCAAVELNCHAMQIDGRAQDLDVLLQKVDPDSVYYVALTQCPALEMPASIVHFHNLKGLEIYNSTIVEWNATTALTQARHPFMTLLYLVHVNVTENELPLGLQDPDFPSSLNDIEFADVSFTTLPPTIASIWPSELLYFYWEHSTRLTEIPAAIADLQIDQLSFACNNLQSIQPDVLRHQTLQRFSVADNPLLQQLPEFIGDVSVLYQVVLDYTNVSRLPSWAEASASTTASNTPYCNAVTNNAKVDCKPSERATISFYPLEIKDRQRKLV